jgi:hypothetical protein
MKARAEWFSSSMSDIAVSCIWWSLAVTLTFAFNPSLWIQVDFCEENALHWSLFKNCDVRWPSLHKANLASSYLPQMKTNVRHGWILTQWQTWSQRYVLPPVSALNHVHSSTAFQHLMCAPHCIIPADTSDECKIKMSAWQIKKLQKLVVKAQLFTLNET